MNQIQLTALTVLVLLATSERLHAGRGIPIPIVFGAAEKIDQVDELPAAVKSGIPNEVGQDLPIGYAYKSFQRFYGARVPYSGDNYGKPPETDASKLDGHTANSRLGKPIMHGFPLCLSVLTGVVIVATLKSKLLPSDVTRARGLLKKPRYQQAIQTYFDDLSNQQTAGDSEAGESKSAEQARAFAIRYLQDHGIPADEAERNLQCILRALGR